uniref:G_PROTEIN_RECEP_F1_2 domain-containing protein n=1 Tax=Panagrellus redivivus TaxID=6233 RepID=A0A7E4UYX1_PANRE
MGCFTSIIVIIGNPVFLPPHYCVFTGGFFRNFGNNNILLILAVIFIFAAFNTISMILLSIVNRYIHVFYHQYRYLFDNKHIFVVNFMFSIIVCVLISFGMRSVYNTSHEQVVAIAQNEARGAIVNYYNESTLFCFTKVDTMADLIIVGTTIVVTLFTVILVFMTICMRNQETFYKAVNAANVYGCY